MAAAYERVKAPKRLLMVYAVAWVLNVAWNPVFFGLQRPWEGLVVIVALTVVVAYFVLGYWRQLGKVALWAGPYLLWMVTATSLNAYVCFNNAF